MAPRPFWTAARSSRVRSRRNSVAESSSSTSSSSLRNDAGKFEARAATWVVSVKRLYPESHRLLDRLAMLAPDPIPDLLIDVAVPTETADYDALEARAGLFAFSLIARAT